MGRRQDAGELEEEIMFDAFGKKIGTSRVQHLSIGHPPHRLHTQRLASTSSHRHQE